MAVSGERLTKFNEGIILQDLSGSNKYWKITVGETGLEFSFSDDMLTWSEKDEMPSDVPTGLGVHNYLTFGGSV